MGTTNLGAACSIPPPAPSSRQHATTTTGRQCDEYGNAAPEVNDYLLDAVMDHVLDPALRGDNGRQQKVVEAHPKKKALRDFGRDLLQIGNLVFHMQEKRDARFALVEFFVKMAKTPESSSGNNMPIKTDSSLPLEHWTDGPPSQTERLGCSLPLS